MAAVDNMKPRRSCGTCRDRRILCDRTAPVCRQCSESNRICKGYALRLSWPKAGDRRRAAVAKSPLLRCRVRPIHPNASFIDMSSRDIELHYYLTGKSPTDAPPTIHLPVFWNPSTSDVVDRDMFQYFQCRAFQCLATFGLDPTRLSNLLMCTAMSGNTHSAKAVLQSLLALSSLHRYGVQSQALELKIASIKSLAAASKINFGTKEVIQHVAAGMLLCSFEGYRPTCTSNQWTWYLTGVKEVLSTISLEKSSQDDDLATLMNWAHYHDVLGRFAIRHWRPEGPKAKSSQIESCPASVVCKRMLHSKVGTLGESDSIYVEPAAFPALELFSEVCDTVLARPLYDTMSFQELEDYKGFLTVLDWRIRSIPISAKAIKESEMAAIIELYKLAMLVYLNRMSGNLLDNSSATQQRIDRAFTLISQLDGCVRQFPIFIFGCEARTEDQRSIIADILSKTFSRTSTRCLSHIKILLDASWAQDDLAEKEMSYWDKVTSIISCCSILPSLY